MNIDKIDDKLYKAIYGKLRVGNCEEIWNKIKNDKKILMEAVEITKDKFGQKNLVKGLTIADCMLENYDDVDITSYNKLINSIYAKKDVARIVMKGASNGGFSFLLQSLWNPNLKLTEEQKKFAVDEAMNKIGTIRYADFTNDFSRKLDDLGINDEDITYINVGGINPIGKKSGTMYINNLLYSLNDSQVHGKGYFDIRYWILRNPNWTIEEKQKLIMDFWYCDSDYEEYLEQWEWGIVNDPVNFKDEPTSLFEKIYIYDYKYETLLKFYGNKEITNRIWDEIEFCKLMRSLRTPKYEDEYQNIKVKRA